MSRVVKVQREELPFVSEAVSTPGASRYEPLSSVWEGSDGELLEAMFEFYATIPLEPILDATYNAGRFWKDSQRKVVSMDIDPQYKPMIVGDNRTMAGVKSASFGVVVYDPPHVGPQGRDKSKKRFDVDFGATIECGKEHDWNLSYLYPPFLKQAKRVLKPNGLLLAKITDMVNNHRSKWPHCDFMRMAAEAFVILLSKFVMVRWCQVNGKRRIMHENVTAFGLSVGMERPASESLLCLQGEKLIPPTNSRCSWATDSGHFAPKAAGVPFRLVMRHQRKLCCEDPPLTGEGQVAAVYIRKRDVLAVADFIHVLVESSPQRSLALCCSLRGFSNVDQRASEVEGIDAAQGRANSFC